MTEAGRTLRQLATAEDTRALGERVAAVLRAGDLLVLTGPLGAGKTVFAQGIGAGLRVTGPVTSPTFVIARVHDPDPADGGRLPLVHVDAYRLGSVAEVDDLDLDADLDQSVTLVEWGEGLVEHLADDWLEVRIDRSTPADADQPDERRAVELIGHGGDWSARLATMPSRRSASTATER
ncbi:MAG: tRNA (adenosine(37)-N6)-threonylcarbamoyltransferase complex ATPase subunit type 1 TsaE [Micromonosporaceae bacterium]